MMKTLNSSLIGLKERLLSDLRTLDIDTKGFELSLRPFSKSYYGRYDPKTKTIIVYAYSDKGLTNLYPYGQLFETLVHEVVHHLQWVNPEYVRVKGIMHNEEFYKMYNKFIRVYKRKLVFKRVKTFAEVRSCSA